jgi:hypothetical protein
LRKTEKGQAELNKKLTEYLKVSGIRIATAKAEEEKAEANLNAYSINRNAWALLALGLVFFSVILCLVLNFILIKIEVQALTDKTFHLSLLLSTLIFLMISIVIGKKSYTIVKEKEEWIIEWFGQYLYTWEKNLHFMFPFFMRVAKKFYVGDIQTTLSLNESSEGGKPSAKVDFIDG